MARNYRELHYGKRESTISYSKYSNILRPCESYSLSGQSYLFLQSCDNDFSSLLPLEEPGLLGVFSRHSTTVRHCSQGHKARKHLLPELQSESGDFVASLQLTVPEIDWFSVTLSYMSPQLFRQNKTQLLCQIHSLRAFVSSEDNTRARPIPFPAFRRLEEHRVK